MKTRILLFAILLSGLFYLSGCCCSDYSGNNPNKKDVKKDKPREAKDKPEICPQF